jgi:hypothetical protein
MAASRKTATAIHAAKIRRSRDNAWYTPPHGRVQRIPGSEKGDGAKAAGPKYWHSRTPQERLWALELKRQEAYGYGPATARLQRVLEIVQLRKEAK